MGLPELVEQDLMEQGPWQHDLPGHGPFEDDPFDDEAVAAGPARPFGAAAPGAAVPRVTARTEISRRADSYTLTGAAARRRLPWPPAPTVLRGMRGAPGSHLPAAPAVRPSVGPRAATVAELAPGAARVSTASMSRLTVSTWDLPADLDDLVGASRWTVETRPVDLPARRRTRFPDTRRPASGLLPSGAGRAAVPCERPVLVEQGYRMGRWSRLAATLAVTFAGVGVLLAAVLGNSPVRTSTITVQSGDTLWSVARQISVQEDPYRVMQQIEDLNAGDQSVLLPGTLLTVPVES
ncbi:LysM peptidoglycan-binding domain-containing protein [Nakamurella silvestris]|nr:LysM peptidoglycan-binding domain-containing protein [Nakamurella silvestris]